MNRPAVHSYLTRYTYGNTVSNKLFTESHPIKVSEETDNRQPGSQDHFPWDLMSGWKQPELDNDGLGEWAGV